MLRNLAPQTTEEKILTVLGTITSLPIKSIRIPKDTLYGTSRGSCFVELHTTLEASQLFTLLSSLNVGFVVDDNVISVSYAKRNIQANQFNCSSSAASVALAAAQWTNQTESNHLNSSLSINSNQPSLINLAATTFSETGGCEKVKHGTVTVNGVTYQKYPPPDASTFQYEESSGYYFDPSTGLYYDPNSQYYYNSTTQLYLYWSAENQTYLPAESKTSQTAVSSVSSYLTPSTVSADVQSFETKESEKMKDKSNEKQDKVKIAKKIAKDMEKWAKTLNQKKETAKTFNAPVTVSTSSESNIPSIFSYSTSQDISSGNDAVGLETKLRFESKKYCEPVSESREKLVESSNIDSDDSGPRSPSQDPMYILQAEEQRLTDWFKLLCLLCKRQFNSKEQLIKHQQASELHKVIITIIRKDNTK